MALDLDTRATPGYPADLRGAAGIKIVKRGLRADLSLDLLNMQQLGDAPAGGLVPVQDPATGLFQALDFSKLPTSNPADGTVTNVKAAAMPALTFKGNAANAAAQPQDIGISGFTSLLGISEFPSRAAAAASIVVPLLPYVRVAGYASPGDLGGGLYVKATSQPAHTGKFQAANGAWFELVEAIVRPEMFGAFGFDCGATPVPETAAIQRMVDYAMYTGATIRFHGQSGTRFFAHDAPIIFTARRTPTTLGDVTVNDPGKPLLVHFCNHPEVAVHGVGNCKIIATQPMERQFFFTYDYSVPNSIQPLWLDLNGLKLDGNSKATKNIELFYCYRITMQRCRLENASINVHLDHVAVSLFENNLMYATDTNINGLVSGDNNIVGGEMQCRSRGIRLGGGGNTKIRGVTFTGVIHDVPCYAIQLLSAPAADAFNGSRDINISECEFVGVDWAVFGFDGSSDPQRDIYNITLTNNHLVRDNNRPNIGLIQLSTARTVSLVGNTCGDDWSFLKTAGVDVDLSNVTNFTSVANTFAQSKSGAYQLVNCEGGSIVADTYRNMCQDTTNQPSVITLYGTAGVTVDNWNIYNTVPCSGFFIVEGDTACARNTFGSGAYPASITTPVFLRSTTSRFGGVYMPRLISALPAANSVQPYVLAWPVTNGSQSTAGTTKQLVMSNGTAWVYANGAPV